MITKEQLDQALKVIADYEMQIANMKQQNINTQTSGCKVKLSKHGLEMQGKKFTGRRGVVLSYLPWNCSYPDDGMVTVKWVGIKKPSNMHVSQVEKI